MAEKIFGESFFGLRVKDEISRRKGKPRPVLRNWCVARPYQVCRRVFVTFLANKQKFFLSLQID